METKHTPGPWQEAGIVGEHFNIMAGTHTVAHVVMDGVHIGDAAAYANARFIASAPDLLAERDRLRSQNAELCRVFQSFVDAIDYAVSEGLPVNQNHILEARAALARAKEQS